MSRVARATALAMRKPFYKPRVEKAITIKHKSK